MHLPEFTLPITDPVLIFALVMVMILVLPLLLQWIRLPGIVGLILAGVIVGPHAFNLLARDETMQLLGTVGILYIMFIAGLEVDLNEFNRQRNRSIIFGASTFILPQGLGTLVGRYGLGFDWPSAILLGAVFASHTLLAYPIVSRLGLSKGEAVTTAVGATILTDTAALLVLAVIVRTTEGALTFGFWIQMIVVLAVYVAAVLWGVPRLGRWFFYKVRSDGVFEFVFVLAVVFVCAFLAALAGVEPIIGAFLAGLALNRLVPEHSTLMNRTRFVGESLFIPFFLISVGMLVDIRVLTGGMEAWIVAGAMLVTVIVTKWLAARTTGPLFGYSTDQTWMLFGLTVPQAAATLATVLIGFDVGLFDHHVLNGTIIMMLVTCMIGPWFAEHYGRRVALRAELAPFEPSRAPQRILVPLANPETAPKLMDMAFMVRQHTSDQPIFPLVIVRDEEQGHGRVAAGEKLLGHAVVHAAAADVPVSPLVRIDPNVASGIHRAIKERMISTVIVGWNGKSAAHHYTFGSILDQLLLDSHELVLVSKIEQPLATIERVVLALPPHIHLDPSFTNVVKTVKVLASQMGARIRVFASPKDIRNIEGQMAKLRPEVPFTFQPLETWADLLSEYEADAGLHDLFLLVAAREGTLAWHPALSQIPRQFADRFPNTDLVVCYAPIPFEETIPSYTLPSGDLVLGGLLRTDYIQLDLRGQSADAVLQEILHLLPDTEPELIRNTTESIQVVGAESEPELMPGVVLYHAHVPGIERTLLLVGISKEGLRFSIDSNPVYVVLALLSPEEGSPENHLRNLALLARLVRSADTIDHLRAATSPEEVRDILANSYLNPRTGWQGRPEKPRIRLRDEVPGGAPYETVGVVVTPRSDLVPLFMEALQRTISFGKRMNLLHVGVHTNERERQLKQALRRAGLAPETPVHWLEGNAEKLVLETVERYNIDLLMVEAFEDPDALVTQLGPTTQALMHRISPSLLLLTHPSLQPKPYRRIAVVVDFDEDSLLVYQNVLRLVEREHAEQLFLVRILPKVGEARILAGDDGYERENERTFADEQMMLEDLLHAGGENEIPVQTFIVEGQTGSAATRFANRYRADLLVLPPIDRYAAFADRLYPSETDWMLREAPCDVWMIRNRMRR